jgi:hypothetical protein
VLRSESSDYKYNRTSEPVNEILRKAKLALTIAETRSQAMTDHDTP